ncbi:MAG: hypothetical protein DRP67_03065 [Candidatus Omnitrophota bacterium]|nr:MAG: hypothetical protein DRP67_03065 [Candidatus Omnitrophota bacterium]
MAKIEKDKVEGLCCECCKKDVATFKIVEDGIVCTWCGKKITCTPPIEFVFKGKCACCKSGEETTFIVDSAGITKCTRCGKLK